MQIGPLTHGENIYNDHAFPQHKLMSSTTNKERYAQIRPSVDLQFKYTSPRFNMNNKIRLWEIFADVKKKSILEIQS